MADPVTARAMTLSAFLVALGRRRWAWGETDCLLVLADWIAIARGVDPGAAYRGRYSDEAGCTALLMEAGGVLRITRDALTSVGLSQTATPYAGDVAVVRAPCWRRDRVAPRDTGAIALGKGQFAVMTPDVGLVIAPFPLRAAWKI